MSHTGKSLSEALIFASTNDRLFIELQVQYMKIPSSNLGRTCCVQNFFLTFRTIFVHNMFSPCSAKRRASDKDLPIPSKENIVISKLNFVLLSSKYYVYDGFNLILNIQWCPKDLSLAQFFIHPLDKKYIDL